MNDIENIKTFWEDRAQSEGTSETATLRDLNLRKLEISTIKKYLQSDHQVLDIGCGNGYATCIFAQVVNHITGLDYSSTMIENARQLKQHTEHTEKINYMVGSVLKIELADQSFDAAISERCLINLPTWEAQQQALLEIHRVLKTGGIYLMMEGTQHGLNNLNRLRERNNLEPIKGAWHNLDFDEPRLLDFVQPYFDVVNIERFGTYYLLSRVVHPMLVAPEQPQYDAKINEVAMQLALETQGYPDISHLALYILKKK